MIFMSSSVLPTLWYSPKFVLFWGDLLFFLKTCRLLNFGLVLIKVCLFFWLVFYRFVLRIAFFWNFVALFLFLFIAKRNLGVFCVNLFILGIVFSLFLYLTCLLVLLFFEFSFQWQVQLVFPLNYPLWACFSNLLPCFHKITWHYWSWLLLWYAVLRKLLLIISWCLGNWFNK